MVDSVYVGESESATSALQTAACHIKGYASHIDLRVPVAAKGECKAANESY